MTGRRWKRQSQRKGRPWGEQVLNWRLVRLVLSAAREQWLTAASRRHALKTVVTARHVMGLRPAAFLTAGRASVPFWKFVVADAGAARRAERWLGLTSVSARTSKDEPPLHQPSE